MKETNFFENFNNSKKEIIIEESYFNNSYEFILIKLIGLIDTYNSMQFFQIIKDFLELSERKVFILDLHKLNYISSTGIGIFVELLKFCNNKKIIFYLMNINQNINEVFNLLGFKSFFNIIKELKDINDEKIERSVFPLKLPCPHCKTELLLKKIGSFKCLRCSNIFRVIDNNGEIRIEKRG